MTDPARSPVAVRATDAAVDGAADGAANGASDGAALRRRYWQLNLRLTAALMLLWFVVSFVLTYFARELSFSFFGWPFSYWLGAQGAILVYLALVAVYAQLMHRWDCAHGVAEDDE